MNRSPKLRPTSGPLLLPGITVLLASLMGCANEAPRELEARAIADVTPFELEIAAAEESTREFRSSATGTLQALRSVTYASSIQSNQAKIVALAPEGQIVKKGDLLVLFDAAPFEVRVIGAIVEPADSDEVGSRGGCRKVEIRVAEDTPGCFAGGNPVVAQGQLIPKDIEHSEHRIQLRPYFFGVDVNSNRFASE